MIPVCDLSRENSDLLPQLLEATNRVARSGRVLIGPEVEAFESELAAWHGVKYAVAVSSGTDAVEVALRAESEPGKCSDGVTTTAMTAVPTICAIEAAGFDVTLLDPDPVTRNRMETNVAVHLYGLASNAKGACVEDCAHSMGALWNGKLAGTMGRCGSLSFFPTKIMGALGDGGAIITNDSAIAERARKIRHYGFEEDLDIETRGQNSRLSELNAAFLRIKLTKVSGWIDRRREIAARYNAELAGRVATPTEPDGCKHVHHVYVLEYEERDRLAAALKARGIGTQIHYPRAIHQYGRWKHLGEPGQFPVAEKLAATVLSLPMGPYLADEEVTAVIAAVKDLT